jgi:hypothetical protein
MYCYALAALPGWNRAGKQFLGKWNTVLETKCDGRKACKDFGISCWFWLAEAGRFCMAETSRPFLVGYSRHFSIWAWRLIFWSCRAEGKRIYNTHFHGFGEEANEPKRNWCFWINNCSFLCCACSVTTIAYPLIAIVFLLHLLQLRVGMGQFLVPWQLRQLSHRSRIHRLQIDFWQQLYLSLIF